MAKFVGARVYNSGNISHATSGTPQALTFDSERFDTDTIHDTVSNTERLTCQTAGKYLIIGNAMFAANATGFRQIDIRLNVGATIIGSIRVYNNGGTDQVMVCVSTIYDLSVGDYVMLYANQNSGGALNVVASANQSPEFMMHRIG